jgi:hypothetical protein
MPEPVETPAATLMRLTNGYQISQAIHVAAELRLADFIGGKPVAADENRPPRRCPWPQPLPPAPRALDHRNLLRDE